MFLLDVFNDGYNHDQSEIFQNYKLAWISNIEQFLFMWFIHARFTQLLME